MSEISMYEAQKKKMQGLCDEHDLVYRFEKDRYPIIFTIKPVQGMDAQISMLENVEEVGYRSPDASMSWIFEDGGLDTKVTGGTFTISKTLRTKIESILVKMITYSDVLTKKNAANIADEDEIAFWPMAKLGDYKFHLSTQMAGLMAQIDTGNGGCPYESPSNKGLQCDGLCLEDGTEVNLTLAQANYLNGIGVDTALNFMSGWVAWGNYTACYPSNTDVKDYFIPVSRMFGWVGNSLVKTFWSKLDKPMTRRLIDTVLDSANIWLNGLVGMGYLLGARVEMLENENPLTNLMAGIIKLHVYMTPPSPAQEIDFVLEYDASYVTSALQG